ncbi:SpoIIE family protein phosphatase [Sporosarcina obsidiansis]|uniref:SpoIIE family protein phosphatase n=1 Tax=Sporosarcina obsidiansis TaxID=2660748 RepID=UPI00129B0E27|nr:SpoIIE family protein phosphatase [Sporosarcina obsidiansis]
MKMIDNMERPLGQQFRVAWQELINRKVYLLTAILFLIGSFFLAQAVVFDMAVPFFLSIWALASMRYRQHMIYVFIGGMAGSAFLGMGQAVIHLTQLLLFHLAIKSPFVKKSIPLAVAGCMIIPQIIWQLVMYSGSPPVAVQLSIGLEALLALFMTIFMLLAFPSIERLLYGPWNPEQVSAMCIVGALATTGMGGLQIGYISVAGVFLFLAIYVAAMVGGVPFATTVGMIIALIIGVSDLAFTGMMALYGMTGLLAGGLKRFGKLGIVTGSLFVSLFFLLYDATLPLDTVHFATIGVAAALFFVIPSRKLNGIRQVFLPKQEGISEKRQQWLADKLDGQLEEFQQFAHFMSTLVNNRFSPEEEVAATLQVPSICQSCFRYKKCWESEEDGIGPLVNEWESTYSATKKAARLRVEEKMKFKCLRFKGLINELEEHGTNRLLMGQLQHGRKMLALQLRDMSTHIEKVMREVKEDLTTYKLAEEDLANRLQAQGVEFFQIDILSEERGACRVVVSVPEKKADFETETTVGEYLILPVLEQMYEEPIYISKSTYQPFPFPHVQLTFSSAVRFSLDYDIVTTAGGGTFQAGDAYEVFKIHDGLSAVLLSDGMGQDVNAYHESRKVIRLMRECLGQKMDPETAIHTLHYMMALNGLDDMYATLDLALIDLQDGRLWSWKAGSMSTYIKRGDECIRLDSKTVPFGFLPSFSIEAKNEQLKSGDILVMMTDGMFNGEISLESQEEVLEQTIERFKEMDCHTIADQIMLEMEREFGSAEDDRTILVMKVDHVVPKWSSVNKKSRIISRQRMVG